MDDSGSSDSWNKLVIVNTNDQWIKSEHIDAEAEETTRGFCLDYDPFGDINNAKEDAGASGDGIHGSPSSESSGQDSARKRTLNEAPGHRAQRLAKMSAYAAQRLANESPEQRAVRLKRMSEYAAKRLANETAEQRARRLSRMSAYAAKRLAKETPQQREERLARMSAYAARRHAIKKLSMAASDKTSRLSPGSISSGESNKDVTAN